MPDFPRTMPQIMDEYASLKSIDGQYADTLGCAALLAEVLALVVTAPDNPVSHQIIELIVPGDDPDNG